MSAARIAAAGPMRVKETTFLQHWRALNAQLTAAGLEPANGAEALLTWCMKIASAAPPATGQGAG